MNRPDDTRWEFGSFRLHTSQRLLFRDGEVVPLSRKAIDILLILIESQGQLVEKDDLMRRVWPDSFVEESNLAVHISLLRKTLGEEAGDYRIGTIPRRGYRFIGAVELLGSTDSKLVDQEPATSTAGISHQSAAGPSTEHEIPAQRHKLGVWVYAGVATALAVALFVLAPWLREKHTATRSQTPAADTLGEKDRIALGEIANNTGDPVFDTTLREAVAIEFEQSPTLSLISDERMQQSLRLMGKPA